MSLISIIIHILTELIPLLLHFKMFKIKLQNSDMICEIYRKKVV